MKTTTEWRSKWNVRVCGSEVQEGPEKEKCWRMELVEFPGLTDPMIIGMPLIDKLGGVETTAHYIGLGGMWLPRLPMPSCDIPNVISSISWVDVAQNPRMTPVGGRNTTTVKLGCDGWYYLLGWK